MSQRIFGRFLKFYNTILNKHKYPVQIVTGGSLWFAGDLLCQSLVHAAGSIGDQSSDSEATLTEKRKKLEIDWQRTGRMTLYGLAVSAPVYAFWYSYLDRWSHRFFAKRPLIVNSNAIIIPAPLRHFVQRYPRIGSLVRLPMMMVLEKMPEAATRRVWEIIGFKLATDCFLFDPAYLSLFFTTTNAMEGRSAAEIGRKLRTDLLPTYLIDIAVWLPIQTINFRWVPVVYQALFVQSCNVGWNAYLSFVQHNDSDHE